MKSPNQILAWAAKEKTECTREEAKAIAEELKAKGLITFNRTLTDAELSTVLSNTRKQWRHQ